MAMAKLLFIFTLLFSHLIGRPLGSHFVYLPIIIDSQLFNKKDAEIALFCRDTQTNKIAVLFTKIFPT